MNVARSAIRGGAIYIAIAIAIAISSFKKIRNKPLPWVCSDCSSGFDLECWAKCKADMK